MASPPGSRWQLAADLRDDDYRPPLLDGSRGREQLLEACVQAVLQRQLPLMPGTPVLSDTQTLRAALDQRLDRELEILALGALLCG